MHDHFLSRAVRPSLLAGVLLVGAASCGRSQTCSSALFDYAGSKSGAIWLTMVSDDGGESLWSSQGFFVVPNPPWQNVGSGVTACSGNSVGPDIPLTATAWIDTTGTATNNCATLKSSLCRPAPGEPQAQQHAVLRAGEYLTLHFTLTDPP